MSARSRHQNAPAQPINNASPYSTAKPHIYKPKDQQSIWLEKVGKAVSLTYHDNIKRIYRNIAKKMPQCFACIRGGWGFIDRIVLLANSELWLGCFTMNNTSEPQKPYIVLNIKPSRGAAGYLRKKIDAAIDAGFYSFKVRLEADESGLYPNRVLPIVATLSSYSTNRGCTFFPSKTTRKGTYADSVGLLKPFRDRNGIDSASFLDKVWRFDRNTHFDVVSGIIDSLRKTTVLAPGLLHGIEYGLNEISDNVLVHSTKMQSEHVEGYVMAQVHRQSNKVAIAVYDDGIGIPDSLRSGGVAFADTKEAIQLALSKGVTDGNGAGNGLWLLDSIVDAASGSLDIQSDGIGYRKVHKYNGADATIAFRNVNTPVGGSTLVDFQVSTNSSISMSDIFEGNSPVNLWKESHETDPSGRSLRLRLADESSGFGSRYDAAKMRCLALNMASDADDKVYLDFADVPFISLSFADEFINKLIREVGLVTFIKKYAIVNLCQSCAEAIDYITRN